MAEKQNGEEVGEKKLESVLMLIGPLEESEHTSRAFKWYCDHFPRRHYQLVMLHCLHAFYAKLPDGESEGEDMRDVNLVEKLREQAKNESMPVFETYFKICDELQIPYKLEIALGNTNKHILAVAEKENAILIVTGNRGLSGWKAKFLGSTSEYLLHHSTIPILIVPPTADTHAHGHHHHQSTNENSHKKMTSGQKLKCFSKDAQF